MKMRLSALLLAMAMICALAACGGEGQWSSASGARPVTGVGESSGYGGPLRVKVTLSAERDRIEKIDVTESGENPGIGGRAIGLLTDSILEEQSVSLDAVSSATLSSQAFLLAVENALTDAGADLRAFLSPVSHDGIGEQTLEADVVVIGAGGAGMTAGITAAQAGRKVVILEKAGIAGGSSVRAAAGLNAAGTQWQDINGWYESANLEKTLDAASDVPELSDLTSVIRREYDAWEEKSAEGYFDSVGLFLLDTKAGSGDSNDPDLVATLAENSAAAIDWLDSIGAQLHCAGIVNGASVKRLHRPMNAEGKILPTGSYLIPILEQTCIDNGVKILFNAPATGILMENGRVAGVRALGYTVKAKAVVIATGGFGADLETVAGLRPEWEGIATTSAPGCMGDGITMAQALGAATVDMDRIQVYPAVDRASFAPVSQELLVYGGILVNSEGVRFCDETGPWDAVSAAVLEQSGGYAYLILDRRIAEASGVIDGYMRKGCALQGSSLSALARKLDMPEEALEETLSVWNEAVNSGADREFGRTGFMAMLDLSPFYAIQVSPGILQTLGGVQINTGAQVLDASGDAIPGLFAAGEVTGGVHGDDCLLGNAMTDFVVFGRIAGESAAAFAE